MEGRIGFCIFLILCNTTLSIVSIATPNWITINDLSDGTIDGYAGLWKACANFEDLTVCKAAPKVEGWLKGVRALMVTGVLLLGLSCVLAVAFARNALQHQYASTCILSLILSGILLLVAMIVYAHKFKDIEEVSFGYSFYLPIPVIILSMGTGIVLHKAKRHSEYMPIQ